jgi:CBS domain-containing protein
VIEVPANQAPPPHHCPIEGHAMGEKYVTSDYAEPERRAFVQALLADVEALECMISEGLIETGKRRIGAEQEYFLVDRAGRPAPVATDVLGTLTNPAFTTEIARYNLEANLPPDMWGGGCLGRLERDLDALLAECCDAAQSCGADALLTGILPTLRLSDLGLENMVPLERYRLLNDATVRLRGGSIPIRIEGIDEFYTVSETVMLESCNTSFQLHFQVAPDEFPTLYNAAQAVTAPLLAGAVNSPVLMGKRLWEETRMALFQSSVDDRSVAQLTRGQLARVRFGDAWIRESVLEIFRDDVARFRVVLVTETGDNALEVLARGEIPSLRALCLHNGTVWRWNRPCYGVSGGVAHLRIENRVLPAGPTVLDQVANAAFYYGLLGGVVAEYGDVAAVMPFHIAKTNFMAAARRGLRAQMVWVDGQEMDARRLILERLLPMARDGLAEAGIDGADAERYLGVFEERVRTGRTGSRWMNDALDSQAARVPAYEKHRQVTLGLLHRMRCGAPVHEWEPLDPARTDDWRHGYHTVEFFMTRDLFTVRADDVVDLAANLMRWKHIRHLPVEDDDGRLVGLISHRDLVDLLASSNHHVKRSVAIRDIMHTDLLTATPDTPTMAALSTMRDNNIGCLPVVRGEHLVGIITERDFLAVADTVLRDQFESFGP